MKIANPTHYIFLSPSNIKRVPHFSCNLSSFAIYMGQDFNIVKFIKIFKEQVFSNNPKLKTNYIKKSDASLVIYAVIKLTATNKR